MITQPESCPTFLAHFHDLRQELLELIRWLVEQESMTRVAAATTAIAENLAEKLQADGVQVDTFTDARYGTNLRARYPLENSSESASDNKQLLIIGHIDTVWPMGTLAQRPFRIEDEIGRASCRDW